MARSCSICTHDAREEIDEALVAGESTAKIAGRYRTIDERALRRHRSNHLPSHLAKAHAAEEVAHADGLVGRLEELAAEARRIGSKAEEDGDYRTALAGVRELVRITELMARLTKELDERPQVNLYLSPEWLELRALIVAAVEPFPEARGSVLQALEGAGNGRA